MRAALGPCVHCVNTTPQKSDVPLLHCVYTSPLASLPGFAQLSIPSITASDGKLGSYNVEKPGFLTIEIIDETLSPFFLVTLQEKLLMIWWWFTDEHTRSEFPLGNLLSFHELPGLQHSVSHHLLWGSWPACILLTFSCTWRNMSKWIALFCSFDTGFFDGEWTEGTGMLVRTSKEAWGMFLPLENLKNAN